MIQWCKNLDFKALLEVFSHLSLSSFLKKRKKIIQNKLLETRLMDKLQ